ncbi:M81 family metallopeptidase [Acuticoccus mangrovi]|uniref:Microcystinase C n=1 Tax=Acuticoccus mangrovi TaxID=2796142 RepID=A0A934MIQ3_9HYPH|nr:M81 family metallopeptidase [Acuticoccus mangrovi]MBJ3778150.1 M81 family metallopeptidase [Acuticoccus mangrovi]
MTRIAIAGFRHESHSFASHRAGWEEFKTPGSQIEMQRAPTMIEALRPTNASCTAMIELSEAEGFDLAPLIWAYAVPSAPVTPEAFERIVALLVAQLSDALEEGPVDGIFLELHGAMMTDAFPDAESELVRRLRCVVGADLPIVATLDPHANLTERLVELTDLLVPYRTYPHVDHKPCGDHAGRLLLEMIRSGKRPAKAYRALDFLTPLPAQCTISGPMAEVMAERARLQETAGVAEVGFCYGFPYADFPGCGMAATAYADTQDLADIMAEAMAADVAGREMAFSSMVQQVEDGVAEAIRIAAGATRPVVLADTQDNPGGGGYGDTMGLLAALIAQNADGAVLGSINDAASAAACHAAGVGATVTLELGGVSDGHPLAVTAVVERLADGNFVGSGPNAKGNARKVGPTALIRIGGVRAIVCSRKMQAVDQALFRHVGIEPAREKIVALKSSVHFRADYQPIAETIIVIVAPGPVVVDPAGLPFQHLRDGLRLRPGDNRRVRGGSLA